MKLDLSEILTHVGMRFAHDIDEPPIVDEDLECTSPVRGNIVFTNTGSVLLVEGRAMARVALACSRCLVYFEQPAEAPLGEQFTLENRVVGPHGRHANVIVEEDENPDAGKLVDGHMFDLTELLRQSITLSLPLQPLHDEACKGLCPHCGRDRNEISCDCETRELNPAFAGLAALLDAKAGKT